MLGIPNSNSDERMIGSGRDAGFFGKDWMQAANER
jgi:hypothetical protein